MGRLEFMTSSDNLRMCVTCHAGHLRNSLKPTYSLNLTYKNNDLTTMDFSSLNEILGYNYIQFNVNLNITDWGFSKTILSGNPTVNARNQIRNAMSKVFQQHPDYFTTGE
ncbi:hypothetical protein CEXT_126241 [Caerostris extrusa]|uniref:Cytochrome c domain-containing protein n=1 Tax=Caerostris extrusa TaxID=172846 RepID=A0AAV4QW75_CAEEX|nr:hypothetical protein CEXT_126241 [Caerostris extrusa]